MVIEVGQFKIETRTGTIEAPAEYMNEQGNAKLDRILEGRDQVFNMSSHLSPNLHTAILVALQTDFAAWRGMRLTMAELRA